MNKRPGVRIANFIIIALILLLICTMCYGFWKIIDIFRFKPREKEDNQEQIEEVVSVEDSSVEQADTVSALDQEDELAVQDETVIPTYLLDYDPLSLEDIPEYSGVPYYIVNDNIPSFTDADKENPTFEYYSNLDLLGRCGVATANLDLSLMPTEERESIGGVKPSGWHTIKYPDLIEDLYLYNRCHLIAFSLAGENANEKNLITGTRYMNIQGMLPVESEVAEYIKLTGNHVLYRVTPCFSGVELVARGVHIEAYSVEDSGWGICINIFAYNVQPGITIDYLTGDSWVE